MAKNKKLSHTLDQLIKKTQSDLRKGDIIKISYDYDSKNNLMRIHGKNKHNQSFFYKEPLYDEDEGYVISPSSKKNIKIEERRKIVNDLSHNGHTQKWIADQLGISQPTVSNILAGKQ